MALNSTNHGGGKKLWENQFVLVKLKRLSFPKLRFKSFYWDIACISFLASVLVFGSAHQRFIFFATFSSSNSKKIQTAKVWKAFISCKRKVQIRSNGISSVPLTGAPSSGSVSGNIVKAGSSQHMGSGMETHTMGLTHGNSHESQLFIQKPVWFRLFFFGLLGKRILQKLLCIKRSSQFLPD